MKNPDFEKGRVRCWNTDCVDFIKTLPAASVDVICIDPPYLYLKNQKLERPFDERLFFSECKRALTDKGFVVMFGRGVSFYRWNCLLDELGMTFKEEIVWDKRMGTSPLMKLCRVHETVSLFTKGLGVINKVKVPYLETREYDINKMKADMDKFMSAIKNPQQLQWLRDFVDGQRSDMCINTRFSRHNVTTDIRKSGNQSVNALAAVQNGITEKSIIPTPRDHFSTIHPTQKPVRLIERLLALVIPDKPRNEIVVADFFAGSMSCMEAVHNMGMNGIACEIDEEYFEAGKKRIDELLSKPIQSTLL